jgi:hypothetical protein
MAYNTAELYWLQPSRSNALHTEGLSSKYVEILLEDPSSRIHLLDENYVGNTMLRLILEAIRQH